MRLAGGLVVVAMVVLGPAIPCATAADAEVKHRLPAESRGQRAASSELIVTLRPGVSPEAYARRRGLQFRYTLRSTPDTHVFGAGSVADAVQARTRALGEADVESVHVNRRTDKVKYAFVPDDPFFHKETPNGWSGRGQWHLTNAYTTIDCNVSGAWKQDLTGLGVNIGIVDDALETTHPDLAPNYSATTSWDFGQNDASPDPVHADDEHGISVAGVAAARGGNGIGVAGAAPHATLSGLRIDFPNQTDAMFVDATRYQSGTNIAIKNHSYGNSFAYVDNALESAALTDSTAAGAIHVFAAGNDRGASIFGEPDANKKQPQNSPHAVTVAALGFDGKFAEYSCFGANVVATMPSSDALDLDSILTTDRTGDDGYNSAAEDPFPDNAYTSLFGGTSSAAPLMAGVLALAKQAQPLLDTRFVKHLLARTSRIVDSADATPQSDGGWRTNTAGFVFNQNYGFGLVDAEALVNAALHYSGVSPLATESVPLSAVGAAIPDNSTNGVTLTFALTRTQPLEEMLVTLNITHTYGTDIEALLTSPDGFTSRLMKQYLAVGNEVSGSWTFCSHAFWGCNPQGTWTLQVADLAGADVGVWNAYAVTAHMGTLLGGEVTTTTTSTSTSSTSSSTTAPYPPTHMTHIGFTNQAVLISAEGLPVGRTVAVMRTDSLMAGDWVVRTQFLAQGVATNWVDPSPGSNAFYRLRH